jgi:hypothetical protein
MRIALCGYEGEHQMPPEWSAHSWDAGAGFSSQGEDSGENGKREVIWFSPACLQKAGQMGLFA